MVKHRVTWRSRRRRIGGSSGGCGRRCDAAYGRSEYLGSRCERGCRRRGSSPNPQGALRPRCSVYWRDRRVPSCQPTAAIGYLRRRQRSLCISFDLSAVGSGSAATDHRRRSRLVHTLWGVNRELSARCTRSSSCLQRESHQGPAAKASRAVLLRFCSSSRVHSRTRNCCKER